MTEETIYRRNEQHRDRWGLYGADSGIERLSERLSASELKRYEVFQGFKDQILETISPDVSVAVWRAGAVLFEEGGYIDVAFFLVKGAAAAYLSKHVEPASLSGDFRGDESAGADASLPPLPGETVYLRQSQRGEQAAGEMTFLSAMDFDLGSESDVVTLGPGEFFGEIGALNGWPQSVTVKALTTCVVVQIRVPALRLLKRQSSAFRKRIEAVYRQRALLPQLRACPAFRDCPEALIAKLAARVDLVSCRPGETVIEEGVPVDALYLVRSGFMRLSRQMGQGRASVTYLSKGMSVGEIELLIDGLDRARFTVSSVGYGELVKIARDDLFEVLRAQPASEQEFWRQAVARIKETGAHLADPPSSEFIEFALDKGLVEGTSILVMNLDVCTRCDDCVRACADTHGGRPRFVREGDRYDNLLIAKSCYHCTDPVCLVGCPTGAIRRANVGEVVEIKEQICIGCATCHDNCPYDAIVMQDTGKTWPADALPKALRGQPRAVASKCDLCHTSSAGPACVRNCPHHCAIRVGSVDEFRALQRTVR